MVVLQLCVGYRWLNAITEEIVVLWFKYRRFVASTMRLAADCETACPKTCDLGDENKQLRRENQILDDPSHPKSCGDLIY